MQETEIELQELNVETPMDTEDEYDPHLHRNVPNSTTLSVMIVNSRPHYSIFVVEGTHRH